MKTWIETEIEEGNLRFTVGGYVWPDGSVEDAVVMDEPQIDPDEYKDQIIDEYNRQSVLHQRGEI